MSNLFVKTILCLLTGVLLAGPLHAATGITDHSGSGTLVPGINRLLAGDEFFLPASQAGGYYYIINETGQAVGIIPGDSSLSLGSFDPGFQGILEDGMLLEIFDTGEMTYKVRSGLVSDGGLYVPPPQINFSPSPVNFGLVNYTIQGASKTLSISISNSGGSDLTLGDLNSSDPLAAPFSLSAHACSNKTLIPSASCQIEVSFAPTTAGDFEDLLFVPSNDVNGPNRLLLRGTGSEDTVFSTDFSQNSLGIGIPAGWTARWEPTADDIAADSTLATYDAEWRLRYEIIDSTQFPGTKDLNIYINDNSKEYRYFLSFDEVNNLGPNVDLLMLFSDPVNGHSEHTDIRLFARSDGTYGAQKAYFFTTKNHQEYSRIYKYYDGPNNETPGSEYYENGPGTLRILSSLKPEYFPFNTTHPWWVRLRVEGTEIKSKIWRYGAIEPTFWQLSVTDTSHQDGPWYGIGALWGRTETYPLEGNHIFHQFSAAALPTEAVPATDFGITEVRPALTNLDAETGNANGWTNDAGSTGNLEVINSANFVRSGAYAFKWPGGNVGDLFSASRKIDLAASLAAEGLSLGDLANGAGTFSFHAWQASYGDNDDPGRIGLRFLDSNHNLIAGGEYFTPWSFSPYVSQDPATKIQYSPKHLIETIPDNAAYVEIVLQGEYQKRGSTGAYFDDLEVGIGVKN